MNIETSFCLPNKCAEHYWEGLEARHNGQCLAVLRDYRTFRQMLCYRGHLLPPSFHFEPCKPSSSP